MADETIFEADGVRITGTRIEIGGTTYPVNGITSVGTKRIPGAASHGPLLFLLGIGGCFLDLPMVLVAMILLTQEKVPTLVLFALVVLILLVLMLSGTLFYAASQAKRGRNRVAVILGTAGGDRQALTGQEGLALDVKRAIERAIEARG